MTLEKNLNKFRKKMNILQSSSILKLSPEERLAKYREKKRQEAEQKKREQEEAELNKK